MAGADPRQRSEGYIARRRAIGTSLAEIRRRGKRGKLRPPADSLDKPPGLFVAQVLDELPDADDDWVGRIVQIRQDGQTDTFNTCIMGEDGTLYWVALNLLAVNVDVTAVWDASYGTLGEGTAQFDGPNGLDHSPTNQIYVADTYNGRIKRYNADGTVSAATFLGTLGANKGEIIRPLGVHVDGAGAVWVADSSNHRVQKFSDAAAFLMVIPLDGWGTGTGAGAANGRMRDPHAVCTDPAGNVYVSDTGNNRVQKFSAAGAFLAKLDGVQAPKGITWNPVNSTLLVVESGRDRVLVLDANLAIVSAFGSSGTGNGQFLLPYGIGVAPDGDVYVTDYSRHIVQHFSPGGEFVSKFGRNGTGAYGFKNPSGISFGTDDSFWTCEDLGHHLDRYHLGEAVPTVFTAAANVGAGNSASVVASCGEGFTLKNGGCGIGGAGSAIRVTRPDGTSGWACTGINNAGTTQALTAYVTCIPD